MVKKITFLILSILLIVSNISFAQTENAYTSFTAEQLKNNKDYSKNYNPVTCKPKILYNCMLDMVNLARQELNFTMPLVKDRELDSMAILQGEFQAKKMIKTSDNVYPNQNLAGRFKTRGYSPCGEELLSKAKTFQGIDEYSYYDVCLELLKPILKNAKQAKILLDPKYTYFGFGWGIDKDMKNIYVSIVLGNDRVKNSGKPANTKNIPYTKKQNGLSGFDEKLCAKCYEDKELEVLSDYVKVEGDAVYFVCDDYKALRKLIGKEGDALALDFVQHSQFKCDGGNITDNSLVNRGFMTHAFTYLDLLDNNEITDKKSTKMRVHIEDVPQEVEEPFEINLLIVKGTNVCRTILKKNIEAKNSAYKEKINFMKDVTTIATTGDFVPAAEDGKVEIKIPFEPGKTTYTYADIEPYLKKVNRPYYEINRIEVIAHNSLNYSTDNKQFQQQKMRAESIEKAFKGHYPDKQLTVIIKYDNSWEEFKKDVVYSEEYYDLTLGTEEDAYQQLIANKGKIAKELEEKYLKKHRFAHIILYVTYPVDNKHEEDLVIFKFNSIVGKKKSPNIPLAMAIQKYMMKKVEEGAYSSKVVNNVKIPQKPEFQVLLNNQLYMKCILDKQITKEMAEAMDAVYKMNTQNPYISFNQMNCEIQNLALKNVTDVSAKQGAIDRLYANPKLPREELNNLNLEFQIKVLEFLNTQPASMEVATLKSQTYEKIKQVRNPKLTTWRNAYKLAAIFVGNGDYAYALSLMNPFLDEKDLSDDFIFSYVSIGGYKEDVYLSDNYAKMVKLAAERDRARLCRMTEKMSICILENEKVKKTLCEQCK